MLVTVFFKASETIFSPYNHQLVTIQGTYMYIRKKKRKKTKRLYCLSEIILFLCCGMRCISREFYSFIYFTISL